MSGTVNNVTVWPGADVLIGDIAATIPAGGADFTLNDPAATPAVTTEWDFVGILDPGGFTEAQSANSNDVPGWGYGIVATGRSGLVITCAFTALEENLVTLGLRYDVSDLTASAGGYSGDLGGRDLQRQFKAAFQVKQGNTIERRITKNFAQIDAIGDAVKSESGVEMTQVTLKIYSDDNNKFWNTYKGAAS